MLYRIEHSRDLSEMPPQWAFYKRSFPERLAAVYETLCQEELAVSGQDFTDTFLASKAGLSSKTAFRQSLMELEAAEFLTMVQDDSSPNLYYITVDSPPMLTDAEEEALDTLGRERVRDTAEKTELLLKMWQRGFQSVFHKQYKIKGHDRVVGRRFIRDNPDWKSVNRVIKWFWLYGYNGESEEMSFSAFLSKWNDYAADESVFERMRGHGD